MILVDTHATQTLEITTNHSARVFTFVEQSEDLKVRRVHLKPSSTQIDRRPGNAYRTLK